ncbi:MAG: glycosyltransferase family 2 protein [Magnetococcus sp. DMHC-6]
MYEGYSVILIAPAYNEELKIGTVVHRAALDVVDLILVVDDGSTDATASVAQAAGAEVLSLGRVMGVGAAIRAGFQLARQRKFDIAVVIAGNNKDNPEEIPRLLAPIVSEGCDFVMGSRYLTGGLSGGDIPIYRRFATRLHPWFVGLICHTRLTESTNGFRSMRLSILDDPRIRLDQSWLDHYELEVYLLIKILQLGYNFKEVPVSKIYPPRQIGQTKMRPFIDWWKMLRPLWLLGLHLKD